MTETTETGGQVVKFDVTEAALVELETKYAEPKVPEGKEEYEALTASIKEVRDIRLAIDKARKEQTAAALAHQRAVNSMGNGIIERLKAIESPMKLCKAEVDDAEDRRVCELEEAEEKRLTGINTRIENIVNYGVVSINDTLEDVKQRLARVEELDPSEGFDEFAKKAAEAQATSLANLKAGIEKLEQAADLDRRTKEIEERERKANADQAERDDADRKKKAKEQQEEQDRLRKLEDEQADRDRKAQAEADEKLRLEQAPDKEKLMVYAQALREVELPSLDSIAGESLMVAVRGWLKVMTDDIESEADRL